MDDKPEPYQWIADNLRLCYKVCHKICRRCPHRVDDMFSEVVLDRVPGIIERWDSTKGAKLSAWVFSSLKLYGHRWLHKPEISRATLIPGKRVTSLDVGDSYSIEDNTPENSSMEDEDNIQYLMRSLTGYERRVVTLYVMYELTFAEIAQKVGVNKDKIAKVYREAIAKCSTLDT